MKRKSYKTQAVAVEIVYPASCRQCYAILESKSEATERTIISKGRDAYTRAPIVRHTLLPFCSPACAEKYQLMADAG